MPMPMHAQQPPPPPAPGALPVQPPPAAPVAPTFQNSVYGGASYNAQPYTYAAETAVTPPAGNFMMEGREAQVMQSIQGNPEMNCPYEIMRPTATGFPNTPQLKKRAHVPIGIAIQPLAPLGYEVPTVGPRMSDSQITRCTGSCNRCYINPFVSWENGGRSWKCNMCDKDNETPPRYYSVSDRSKIPELATGCVEFIANTEYMLRPPQPPCFVFLIDVSMPSVQSGMMQAAVTTIRKLLMEHELPGGERCKFAIMTYDNSVHFYDIGEGQSTPQMRVMPDLQAVFSPVPAEDVLVHAASERCKDNALQVLDLILTLFGETKVTESCLGSAITAAVNTQKKIGGKLLVFASQPASKGQLMTPVRDSETGRAENVDRIQQLLKPTTEDYTKLAEETLVQEQISCEMFFMCMPSTYFNLATIKQICTKSAGALRVYTSLKTEEDKQKLEHEVIHCCTREQGWEAVMRTRVSRGWYIKSFYGNFPMKYENLIVLPNVSQDTTAYLEIDFEDESCQNSICYIQCALLYTTSNSERRIRVLSMAIPTYSTVAQLQLVCDPQVISCFVAHEALDIRRPSVQNSRTHMESVCRNIMGAISRVGTGDEEVGDLSIFPLYILGMLKSPIFRPTQDLSPDMRVYLRTRLGSLPVDNFSSYFCPRLIGLHDLENPEAPNYLSLTCQVLTQEGVYLMEDGESLLIWCGQMVEDTVLSDLFGCSQVENMNPSVAANILMDPGNEGVLACNAREVIQGFRMQRLPHYLNVQVVRPGDPAEAAFFALLIEDRTTAYQHTYAEFCARLGIRA